MCRLIPLWPFYRILMFGFLLTAFVAFLQMVKDIISFVRGEYLDAEIEVTTVNAGVKVHHWPV
jgi:hypothetical protein